MSTVVIKKDQQGFGMIAPVSVVVIAGLIGSTGWLLYSRQHHASQSVLTQQVTPTTVKSAADAYLVNKVGKDGFNKYYAFDKDRSSYANPKDSKFDFMAYHFSPLKAITDYDDVIMVQVNRDNLGQVFADSVPDCVNDKSNCNFKVDRNEALVIAKHKSLTASDLVVGWHTKNDEHAKAKGLSFVVVVSSCTQSKSVFIDYRNGDVIGTNSNCGGTD